MQRYLIVGLGNPGKKYEQTRHNVGFMTVEELAAHHNLKFDGRQAKAHIADGVVNGYRVILAKPQTYMNDSGRSVQGIADFYKISPAHIMVIYDDLDIDLGVLRIRAQGGSGGHNGMKSIISSLGNTQDFPRIRFGIGRPPGRMDPAAYVLRPFNNDEIPLVTETVRRAALALEAWLDEGIDTAMNRYNGTVEEVLERQRRMTSDQNE